jgi:DNA-binding transcriptional MerR regulator
MDATANGRSWRVGELAEQTGLTVRALHHYHEIGLLVPSARTGAGHRLYTAEDVRRLHRIRALRGFGLSLAKIGELLAGTGPDPTVLLRHQLTQLDERIAVAQRLRNRLLGVLAALDAEVEPSGEEFVALIEVMTTMEHKLTPQQVADMTARRAEARASMSPEELAEMDRRRAEYAATLTPEQLAEMRRKRTAMLPDPPAGA